MKIIKKVEIQSSWAELKAAAEAGNICGLIQSGDLIPFTLKNGKKVEVRATRDGNGKLFFVLEDCMKDDHAMNKELTNKGGWSASDMREYLNTEVYALLPDDLQAVIAPTTIVQIVDGGPVASEDKLFLLSTTQVFGKGAWSAFEPDDTQLDCFRREKARVKERVEYGNWWWWLRSPVVLSSSIFYSVTKFGHSHTDLRAYTSAGVVFGFRI